MLESKQHLNEDTIACLQDLVRVNRDSAQGFREAAEKVDDGSLKPIFQRYAEQRDRNLNELSSYVEFNDATPQDDGSISARVHRSWMGFRSALTSNNRKAMLQEAERGEDHIKEAYEEALKKTAGSAMTDVLNRQYAEVKSAHDKIKHFRDATR